MNEARLAQLEAAVSELTNRCEEVPALWRVLEQPSARLKRTETAFRRWRLGVVLTAVLGCLLLPPFLQESTAAKKPPPAQRLTRIEQALFGVSPVPLAAQDRITTASASLTDSLQTEINLRQSAVTTIHNIIDPLMTHVSVDDGVGTRTEIMFHDANVHVVSGSGETNGTVNGLGNLIVGYNEHGNPNGDTRIGSHN